MDGHRMLSEGLWCALAGLYGARKGCWSGSGLACTVPWHISVSRDAHASRATIITARDCCQSGIAISVSLDISRYLGRALIAREAYGRLPLFEHMLIPLFHLFSASGTTGYLPLFL